MWNEGWGSYNKGVKFCKSDGLAPKEDYETYLKTCSDDHFVAYF